MLRTTITCSLAAALLAACGGQDDADRASDRAAREQSRPASAAKGVDPKEFAGLELRSPRTAISERFGAPAATSRPNAATECLDYPALNASRARVPGLHYRFCFNQQGEMVVRTTVQKVGR